MLFHSLNGSFFAAGKTNTKFNLLEVYDNNTGFSLAKWGNQKGGFVECFLCDKSTHTTPCKKWKREKLMEHCTFFRDIDFFLIYLFSSKFVRTCLCIYCDRKKQ